MTDSGEAPLSDPVAYFLTWPTYGTWLPGDERGWVQRSHGWRLPDTTRQLEAAARMTEDACRLNDQQRRLVESTIGEHCRIRNWTLHAVNCRTNHLHVVVTAAKHPDKVRDELKAWCTRRLKELQQRQISTGSESLSPMRQKWWAERGSNRFLNDQNSLEAAILYVRDAQDTPRLKDPRSRFGLVESHRGGSARPTTAATPTRRASEGDKRTGQDPRWRFGLI
jgi:REP element-mobilizing transposase RayT